jgi:hypothetical protein
VRFQILCGTVHRTLKNKRRKEKRLKFYKAMAIPAFIYGSEIWVPTKKVQTRIQSTEMSFLWKTKGCTKLDHITNEMIRTELNIYTVNDTVEQYRNNWFQHVSRIQDTRLPKRALQYRPSGKRQEDQRKDGEMQCEDGTGKMLNPWSEEDEEELVEVYQ